MKRFTWMFILLCLIGSSVKASSLQRVGLTVPGFVRINITGSASIFLLEDDFVNQINEKAFQSDVRLTIMSNQRCTVRVSGSNFASDFPISRVEAQVSDQMSNYIPLSTTGVNLISFAGKQDNKTYGVIYKLTGIPQLAMVDYDTYSTTIQYTAVVIP